MKRAFLTIRGDVQGVGFRAWMAKEAIRRVITGYVRNLEDGAVEALLEGEPSAVSDIVALCKRGPVASKVHDIEVQYLDSVQEYESFQIKRD